VFTVSIARVTRLRCHRALTCSGVEPASSSCRKALQKPNDPQNHSLQISIRNSRFFEVSNQLVTMSCGIVGTIELGLCNSTIRLDSKVRRCIAALMACVVLALPCSTCPIVPPVMIDQYNQCHHTLGPNTPSAQSPLTLRRAGLPFGQRPLSFGD
jgi:hypothetical protein